MKITHRIPAANWWSAPESDPVPPEYQAEVDQSTGRAEREFRRAKQRFERAEAKLAEARARQARSRKSVSRKQIAELEALLELRREELRDWERMMVTVAASAEHRGTKSFRPVPDQGRASRI